MLSRKSAKVLLIEWLKTPDARVSARARPTHSFGAGKNFKSQQAGMVLLARARDGKCDSLLADANNAFAKIQLENFHVPDSVGTVADVKAPFEAERQELLTFACSIEATASEVWKETNATELSKLKAMISNICKAVDDLYATLFNRTVRAGLDGIAKFVAAHAEPNKEELVKMLADFEVKVRATQPTAGADLFGHSMPANFIASFDDSWKKTGEHVMALVEGFRGLLTGSFAVQDPQVPRFIESLTSPLATASPEFQKLCCDNLWKVAASASTFSVSCDTYDKLRGFILHLSEGVEGIDTLCKLVSDSPALPSASTAKTTVDDFVTTMGSQIAGRTLEINGRAVGACEFVLGPSLYTLHVKLNNIKQVKVFDSASSAANGEELENLVQDPGTSTYQCPLRTAPQG